MQYLRIIDPNSVMKVMVRSRITCIIQQFGRSSSRNADTLTNNYFPQSENKFRIVSSTQVKYLPTTLPPPTENYKKIIFLLETTVTGVISLGATAGKFSSLVEICIAYHNRKQCMSCKVKFPSSLHLTDVLSVISLMMPGSLESENETFPPQMILSPCTVALHMAWSFESSFQTRQLIEKPPSEDLQIFFISRSRRTVRLASCHMFTRQNLSSQ